MNNSLLDKYNYFTVFLSKVEGKGYITEKDIAKWKHFDLIKQKRELILE